VAENGDGENGVIEDPEHSSDVAEEEEEEEHTEEQKEESTNAEEPEASEEEEEEEEEEEDGEEGEMNGDVQDRFFNLDDMERFIEEAEIQEERMRDEEEKGKEEEEKEEDEEGIEEEEEEEDLAGGVLGGGIKYGQFFDAPEEGEDEDEDDVEALKPKKKKQKNKNSKGKGKGELEEKDKIAQLEDMIVGPKPWQLRGEVGNRRRPFNSLLEEHVEFETVMKQAPVITEEVTQALEDIIKRRILEGSFDDVMRKEEDDAGVGGERARAPPPELDFQKSQKSLAELYEEEYLKGVDKANAQTAKSAAQVLFEAEEKKKTKEQEEVLRRFAHLAYKLDALSNFHFTPKPVLPELTIRENVAAIRMEEVIPIGVSDASLLAPHEVFAPDKKASALPAATAAAKKRKRKRHQPKQARCSPSPSRPPSPLTCLLLDGTQAKTVGVRGSNIKRAEKAAEGTMTSTKLFQKLTQESRQTAKGGGQAAKAQTQKQGPRKDTTLKL